MVTVEFKGITNKHLSLVVTHLDQRRRPEEQIEIIDIEGRSGSLVDRYGDYKSYERKIEFVHMKQDNAREIHKWLSGKGVLRTSEEQYGYFYADVVGELERKLAGSGKSILTTTFLVEPYLYLDAGKNEIEITQQSKLYNIGSIYADPLIKVFGTGDGQILINSQVIQFSDIQDYLMVDAIEDRTQRQSSSWEKNGTIPDSRRRENIVFLFIIIGDTPRWRERMTITYAKDETILIITTILQPIKCVVTEEENDNLN